MQDPALDNFMQHSQSNDEPASNECEVNHRESYFASNGGVAGRKPGTRPLTVLLPGQIVLIPN
jgi:hypothetical protein